jgi:uncharacterized membrane protein YdbT with pleckstrin-like domain
LNASFLLAASGSSVLRTQFLANIPFSGGKRTLIGGAAMCDRRLMALAVAVVAVVVEAAGALA